MCVPHTDHSANAFNALCCDAADKCKLLPNLGSGSCSCHYALSVWHPAGIINESILSDVFHGLFLCLLLFLAFFQFYFFFYLSQMHPQVLKRQLCCLEIRYPSQWLKSHCHAFSFVLLIWDQVDPCGRYPFVLIKRKPQVSLWNHRRARWGNADTNTDAKTVRINLVISRQMKQLLIKNQLQTQLKKKIFCSLAEI